MIIIDQSYQTARLYAIQATVIYSRAILVAVTSECRLSVKPGLGHWQTEQTQIRRRRKMAPEWDLHCLLKLQEVL